MGRAKWILISLGVVILSSALMGAIAGNIQSNSPSPEPLRIDPESKTEPTPSKLTVQEKTQEEKVAEQKIIEQKKMEALKARQEAAKLVSDEEMDRRLAELESTKFDPIIVQSALENIPDMQSLPREVLKQCKAVKSYSDYLILGTAVGLMSEDLIQALKQLDVVLSVLELQGYDKHPKVGPLIRETRSLAGESGDCVIDLVNRYEN